MNICVYGASSNSIAPEFIAAGEEIGKKLVRRGHSLVYGAGGGGMMGAAARGVYAEQGHIVGIAPKFFDVDGVLFEHCDELIRPDTMRQRKQMMEERSDAFIVLPGGIGTYEEFFEILTLKQLARHKKPIALYNIRGYFDPMQSMMEATVAQYFMNEATLRLYEIFDNADALLDYLENYQTEEIDIRQMKDIK